MQAQDIDFARRYRQKADALFPGEVQEVRIFGSRGRGEERPDSDLDLFVLMQGEDAGDQRHLDPPGLPGVMEMTCPTCRNPWS